MSSYGVEMIQTLFAGILFALVIAGLLIAKDWMDGND